MFEFRYFWRDYKRYTLNHVSNIIYNPSMAKIFHFNSRFLPVVTSAENIFKPEILF